jgi:inner membrane protein YidH
MRPLNTGKAGQRFPQWVYGHGTEPDPRFSLANERTFLSWVRTALALIASGVALRAVHLPIPGAAQSAAAFLLIVLGLVAVCQGWIGWMRTERALREHKALSGPSIGPIIVVGIAVSAAIIGMGSLL